MTAKIIIVICVILILVLFLTPQTREFLNEKVQSIFFKEVKEKLKEKELIGSIDIYNPRVEEIQEILRDVGFSPGPIDGRLAWQTRKAIREFQQEKGLKVTGFINSETLLELNREKVLVNHKKERIGQPLFLPIEERSQDIKSKKEILKIMGPQDKEIKEELPKDRIKQIQIALKRAGFDAGLIDGKIGKKTRRAIREFQKAKGLKVDGIAGKATWQELEKYLHN